MPCEKSVKGKLRHQEQAGTDSECGLLLIPYVNNELDCHALPSEFQSFIWSDK